MATPELESRMDEEFFFLTENPPPNFVIRRLRHHKREWHFVLSGDPYFVSTSGNFHGSILLPQDYPNSPPKTITLFTPMDPPILQMENSPVYNTLETWHPNNCSVSTVLTELFEWIIENARLRETYKQADARTKATQYLKTLHYNCENPVFRELFPEYVEKYEAEIEMRECLGIQHTLPFEEKRKRDYSLYSLIIVFLVCVLLIMMALSIMLRTTCRIIGWTF